MSTQTIPAKTTIRCDCCDVECGGKNYIHNGRLTLRRAALDFQGAPVADASISLDLCDRCNDGVGDAINAFIKAMRAAPQEAKGPSHDPL